MLQLEINLNAKIDLIISQSNDPHNPERPSHYSNDIKSSIIIIIIIIIVIIIAHSQRIRSRHWPIRGGAMGHDRFVF
jgi:hypothetical protein